MRDSAVRLTPRVIAAINGELRYQSSLPDSGRADRTDHGVAGQLVTLEDYTRKATTAWVQSNGDQEALNALRKIAAIACRALVLYGCPTREGFEE
jgi:hypothetical protein